MSKEYDTMQMSIEEMDEAIIAVLKAQGEYGLAEHFEQMLEQHVRAIDALRDIGVTCRDLVGALI